MRTPRESGTKRARRALAVGVVVAVVAATSVGVAATSVGVAGAQPAGNATTVDSCTTIDSPGKYVLNTDITGAATAPEEACIEVAASDVVLDGQGHLLAGNRSGHGVAVNGTTTAVTNVTVRRLHAANWSIGVFYLGADDGTIERTITNDTTEGVKLAAANRNLVTDTTGYDNAIAVSVAGESQNNTLRNNVAVENKWGVHFERNSPNNTVINTVVRNNSKWGYYSLKNGGTNTVTDLRLATATVSFTGRNVALRSVGSPPALPRGTRSLGAFVEAMATNGRDSSLSLTMDYDPRAASGSSASLWHSTDGQHWSGVNGARVNASSNAVSTGNLTEFGIFAPLADAKGSAGGPVTVSAAGRPSVRRTLTTASGAPSATPTNASTPTGADASTAAESGASTAAGSGPSTPAATVGESAASSSNASGEATDAASGESNATIGTFDLSPARLLFVGLGLVGLVALGLVALQRRGGRGGGF